MALSVIEYNGVEVLSDDGVTPLDPSLITGEGGAMLQTSLLAIAADGFVTVLWYHVPGGLKVMSQLISVPAASGQSLSHSPDSF